MSYLLDKKIQRKKFSRIAIVVVAILILLYFRGPIFRALSYVTHVAIRPLWVVGNGIGGKFSTLGAYFSFKSSISNENNNLKMKLEEQSAMLSNHATILEENIKLKEAMGRAKPEIKMVLAAILSKPNRSAYDTLVVDVGTDNNIRAGAMVYAQGGVPIGKISSVSLNSATAILFSNSGEKTEGIISTKDVFLPVVGRGGGNFEMILPRDFTVNKGDEVVLPGIIPRTFAVVGAVVSDPRDSFVKALLVSPVNIQEIKFVEVEI